MLLGTIRNKRLYKKAILIVFMLLMLSSLFACSKKELAEEKESYILKISDEIIPTNEIMVYVYQVVEEFQNIGGQEVWEFEDFSGGKSATEVAKDAVLENILRMKVLNEKSIELNIQLDEEDINEVKLKASNYLAAMTPAFVSDNNITLELMEELFAEFAISEKVIRYITNDYNPSEELIDEAMLENEEYARLREFEPLDLLTEYTVSHILLQTKEKNQSGEYVMLTDGEKELQYNLALEIEERAKSGEDFKFLMDSYSEEIYEIGTNEYGVYKFSKALLPEQFKVGLVNLGTGEISSIIESESGYHIFKVDDIKLPSDEEVKTFEENYLLYLDNLRKSVIDSLKKEAFEELYFKWKESVNISIDSDAWDEISLRF